MRRIAGCVPIRKIEDEQDPLKGLCLLLINSRKRANTLVFPKGGIKRHEEAAEAALRETYEEAGVEGPILAQLEPHYCITSPGEWVNLEREAPESWFLMQVKQTHEDWPEREERTRLWVIELPAHFLMNVDFTGQSPRCGTPWQDRSSLE